MSLSAPEVGLCWSAGFTGATCLSCREARRGRPGPLRLSESEDLTRDHHPLDLRGPLADLGQLGVAEDALDGEFRDVAGPAVDLQRCGRRLHRDLGGEDL